MQVIDAHTHWYPDFISQNPCAWAELNREPHWGRLMAPRPDGKRILQGFPSIDKFLRDMDDAQIERAVIQGWYWENQKNCEALNSATMDAIAAFPDRLSAFCAINPSSGNVEAGIRRAFDMGFIGIGELHDAVQGFDFKGQFFAELCESARRYNMPISIHLSDAGGKDYPNKICTDNAGICETARQFPEVKFILSHWGGGDVFREGFAPQENVFYDTAANSFLYGKSAWKKIKGALADKMVYGSDYPLRLYPSVSENEEMRVFASEASEFTPAENHEKFFSGNFLSLYNNS